ncbi:MAG: FtsX-like permease family protein [Ahniella sp.]|nr:FtsX-like permease family protein [Ahniella sp.]
MEVRPILSTLFRNKTAPLLIAAQVALTLAIVANSLYIIRERLASAARPTGLDEPNIGWINLSPVGEVADPKTMQEVDLNTLRAIPGVRSATWANMIPLSQSGWNSGGMSLKEGDNDSGINSAHYFSPGSLVDTFGLNLIAGRDFTADDVFDHDPEQGSALPKTVIISKALAEALLPNEADLGQLVGQQLFNATEAPVTIIGIVDRLQTPWSNEGADGEQSYILPIRYLVGSFQYAIRTEPGQLDRVMKEAADQLSTLRSDRVLNSQRTFAEIRASRYANETLMAGLLIAVTLFLLLITASGIVGLSSLWVNQRRKQIGVRRALGARRIDVIRYFLVENMLITSGGVLLGLLLTLALNQVLVRQMEVPRLPAEYVGFGMVIMWLLGVASVLGPALRAARVPPAVATRTV